MNAKFLGIQQAPSPLRPMELWNTPTGTTVSRRWLDDNGVELPATELARAAQAWHDWNNSSAGDDHLYPLVGGRRVA